MSKPVVIVYPHQLFEQHPALSKRARVFLVEDPLFFKQYLFHKKKILLHRSSMKYYERFLKDQGHQVTYLEFSQVLKTSDICSFLNQDNVGEVVFTDLDDNWLETRLKAALRKSNIDYKILPSPGYLSDISSTKEFLSSGESNKRNYFQTSFYIAQRKKFNILLDKNGPEGESWTFDKENRKKLPKGHVLTSIKPVKENLFIQEAKKYVQKNFKNNPGNLDGLIYPSTHEEARNSLDSFIDERLRLFGDYQDAICTNECFLYHSLLSAPLNIGLITPSEIIDKVIARHSESPLPLNSLEGFIRQIVGWREFFRAVYSLESVNQRNRNFFGFSRKIPKSFWEANTGILPIDLTIKKILKNSYAHHIERLMVMGNFMLLCEFDPDEVYRWFMELFIDSYDWVMVPNVYGMSQYADGGLITTKPYISSSNYIKKMSDFKTGEWCEIWDGLYWNFISSKRSILKNNQRMSLMIKQLDRMDTSKLEKHKTVASSYLSSLGS